MPTLTRANIRKALCDHKVLLYRFISAKETVFVTWLLDSNYKVRKHTIRIPKNMKDDYYDNFSLYGQRLTYAICDIRKTQYFYKLILDEPELGKIGMAFLKSCTLCTGMAYDTMEEDGAGVLDYNKPLPPTFFECAMKHYVNGHCDKYVKTMVELHGKYSNVYKWSNYELYKGE